MVVTTLVALFAAGALVPYVRDDRLFFNLHLLRSDGVLIVVCQVLVAATAVRLLGRADATSRWIGGCLAFGCFSGQWIAIALAAVAATFLTQAWQRNLVAALTAVVVLAGFALSVQGFLQAPATGAAVGFAAASLLLLPGKTGRPPTLVASVMACVAMLAVLWVGRKFGHVGLSISLLCLLGLAFHLLSGHWSRLSTRFAAPRLLHAGILGLALGAVLVSIAPDVGARRSGAQLSNADMDWMRITRWFRNSRANGPVLVPLQPAGVEVDYNFQLHARKPVWVDLKQGAAVMWSPAYHDTWESRRSEVAGLKRAVDFLTYAKTHGIQVFVVDRQGTQPCPAGSHVRYANATFSACEVASR